jgi:hypothetical protein
MWPFFHLLESELTASWTLLRERTTFDLGFDLAQSDKTVNNVAEDGRAWTAGLRDGQQLLDSSVHEGEVGSY